MWLQFSLLALVIGASAAAPRKPNVETVVVLMLENRAFDHMCGWLNRWMPEVDGLTGKEYNVANGTRWYVNDTCPYINPFDPDHQVAGTTWEIMGGPNAYVNPEPMSGFADLHMQKEEPEYWTVMHGFSPERVPAISNLARNFAVFDRYFVSVPGPTMPNRMYFLTGTSHGLTSSIVDRLVKGLPMRTMFDALNDANITWAVYYHDVPDVLVLRRMRFPPNVNNIFPFSQFLEDSAAGKLPQFVWINPQFYPWPGWGPASDQHPDHDVVAGEKLIAQVYGAMRRSPQWNRSATVITYDEHGGFYDHVPPRMDGVPNPDGINSPTDGFNFTRGGLRVCTVVASPLVPKGLVVHEPSDPKRSYEHSSMYATLKHMYGLSEELTRRTAFAAPWDWIFNLTSPRTDCPMDVPVPPADSPQRTAAILEEQLQRPPNGLQQELFATLEGSLGRPVTMGIAHRTQQSMASEAHDHVRSILKRP